MIKKLFVLLAIPLSAISSFTSCAKDKHIINENEFYDAISFKDVEYMQAIGHKPLHENMPRFYNFSPNTVQIKKIAVFYEVKPNTYSEYFVRKNIDGTFEGLERFDEHDEFKPLSNPETHFLTPQMGSLLDMLEECFGKNPFNSFTYENNCYVAHVSDKGSNAGGEIRLQFLDKKLISQNIILQDEYKYGDSPFEDLNCTYTYEKKDIVWPIS